MYFYYFFGLGWNCLNCIGKKIDYSINVCVKRAAFSLPCYGCWYDGTMEEMAKKCEFVISRQQKKKLHKKSRPLWLLLAFLMYNKKKDKCLNIPPISMLLYVYITVRERERKEWALPLWYLLFFIIIIITSIHSSYLSWNKNKRIRRQASSAEGEVRSEEDKTRSFWFFSFFSFFLLSVYVYIYSILLLFKICVCCCLSSLSLPLSFSLWTFHFRVQNFAG